MYYNNMIKTMDINEKEQWRTMSIEEGKDLVLKAKSGDTKAKNELILKHIGLVESLAKRFVGVESYDDLIQNGIIGLITAINNYDCASIAKFSTYATYHILNEMRSQIANNSKAMKYYRSDYNKIIKIKKIESKLTISLNRVPTVEEIATEANLSSTKVTELLNISTPFVSLNKRIDGNDEDIELQEILSDNKDFTKEIINSDVKSDLQKILKNILTESEIEFVKYRYGLESNEPLSQPQIAKKMNTTRQWVSQLEMRVLHKLAKSIYANELKIMLGYDVDALSRNEIVYIEEFFGHDISYIKEVLGVVNVSYSSLCRGLWGSNFKSPCYKEDLKSGLLKTLKDILDAFYPIYKEYNSIDMIAFITANKNRIRAIKNNTYTNVYTYFYEYPEIIVKKVIDNIDSSYDKFINANRSFNLENIFNDNDFEEFENKMYELGLLMKKEQEENFKLEDYCCEYQVDYVWKAQNLLDSQLQEALFKYFGPDLNDTIDLTKLNKEDVDSIYYLLKQFKMALKNEMDRKYIVTNAVLKDERIKDIIELPSVKQLFILYPKIKVLAYILTNENFMGKKISIEKIAKFLRITPAEVCQYSLDCLAFNKNTNQYTRRVLYYNRTEQEEYLNEQKLLYLNNGENNEI